MDILSVRALAGACGLLALLAGESLVSIYDGTGNVAVADVSNPRQLWFDQEGATASCGWAYTAAVVDRISGEGKTFEFVIPSEKPPEKPVPAGRYLVYTKRDSHRGRYTAFEQCVGQLDYYMSLDIEMLFPVIPDTGNRKIRGPTREDSMLDHVPPCGIDESELVYCVDDVREEIRKIRED
jgi:hypothetical protein